MFTMTHIFKKPCFERKKKSEMKLDSENLFELATLEINATWRMQYFVYYFLNTTVCEFNNFNIGTVSAIQKKLSSWTKWANKLKVHFKDTHREKST